jgi:hypothetical protein
MLNNPQMPFERNEAMVVGLTYLRDISGSDSNPGQVTLMTKLPGFFEPSRKVIAKYAYI